MTCKYCESHSIIKKGQYFVKHSRSWIRRYQCNLCKKTFSKKTHSPLYCQKKPFLNSPIFSLLMSGNTQRRTAKLLRCSKTTVERKFLWLSLYSTKENITVSSLHLQIDELETIEHTKLKPLTVPVCVNSDYQILDLSVGKIKAKGHLSDISVKKYGFREDERQKSLEELLNNLKKNLPQSPLTITTDALPIYRVLIKKYFPESEHIVVASKELVKKKKELIYTAERKRVFDPLFAVNQRFAMLRSDIRRLTRRSWCTTKKIENLRKHLELYQIYNNQQIKV